MKIEVLRKTVRVSYLVLIRRGYMILYTMLIYLQHHTFVNIATALRKVFSNEGKIDIRLLCVRLLHSSVIVITVLCLAIWHTHDTL